ncbi:APC family permease [Mycolicibacterium sp. P1-18]|uniref:APC family permease n=1 Tax=Mycolicibacterium sp. P1-18 TaxID=2024615 RepID=UPI0011F214CA|nr:APC family permease [Mycolicibacterium sp. P1-18]KAA0092064.1 APC family permease [Mycolicibacterium sp. P1-18]
MTDLKRVLNLRNLVVFGLAYLAPTVVFNYYGVVTTMTGGMMTLAYVVTTVAMFFTAYSYATMVRAFPVAGSAYTYVRKAVHPHLGFLTGWVMLLDYILLPMVCYLLIGIYMNEFVTAVPVWVWVVAAAVIGAVTNIVGVKLAAGVNTVVVAAQILFALVLIGIVVAFVMQGNGGGTLFDSAALFDPTSFNGPDVLWAASILAASFLGFDAVSTMAEETVDPARTMPRAVLIVPIAAGIGFSVISYFLQIAWPTAATELDDPDAGIFELLVRVGGDTLSTAFLITDNLASMVCAIAGLAAASRILFGMGRDGVLPRRFFGTLNNRFQTPVNNILLMTAIALTAVFYADNLIGAAALVAFGALSGFIMVNYAVINHFVVRGGRRSGGDLMRYLLLPGIGIVVCATLLYNVDVHAKILGLVWFAAGVVYLGVTTRGFRVPPRDIDMSEDDGGVVDESRQPAVS